MGVEKFTIEVDGQEVPLKKHEKVTLISKSPLEQVTAYWSNDNVVEIDTPHNRVQHQGKTVIVEEKSSAGGSHCGLCGDYNQDKRADLKSPQGCVFKSRTLFGKSYRSKSDECRPLSQRTQEQIREEEERCIKFNIKKTDIKKVFERSTGTARPSRDTPTSTKKTRSVSPRSLLSNALMTLSL